MDTGFGLESYIAYFSTIERDVWGLDLKMALPMFFL
jgi:hypothetical protein